MTSRKNDTTDTTASTETVATEPETVRPRRPPPPRKTLPPSWRSARRWTRLFARPRQRCRSATPWKSSSSTKGAHAADVIAKTKVVGRIKAGQSRDEAIAAVVELVRVWLEQEIPAGVDAGSNRGRRPLGACPLFVVFLGVLEGVTMYPMADGFRGQTFGIYPRVSTNSAGQRRQDEPGRPD